MAQNSLVLHPGTSSDLLLKSHPRTPVISVDSTACHVIKDVVNDFRMRGSVPVKSGLGEG